MDTLEYPIRQVGEYAYSLKNSLLGQTKNSKVYQGINTLSNEPVAIKVIQIDQMNKFEKEMLQNEIEAIHELKKSLNIVKVHKVYEADKQMFIVMQKCNGDLQKLLKQQKLRDGGLQQKKAMQIMNQILNGYKKIYQSCLIHRDLKLANIFLKNGRVKIADFGYAIKAKKQARFGMVKTKQNVGSPLYMSPQCLSKNIYSYKSDIWALGCIYYELLFGKQLWNAISQQQLLRQISQFQLQDKILFQISQQSHTFLFQTLNIDLQERFQPQQFIKFSFSLQEDQKIDHHYFYNQSPMLKRQRGQQKSGNFGIILKNTELSYKFDKNQFHKPKNLGFNSFKNSKETNKTTENLFDLAKINSNPQQKQKITKNYENNTFEIKINHVITPKFSSKKICNLNSSKSNNFNNYYKNQLHLNPTECFNIKKKRKNSDILYNYKKLQKSFQEQKDLKQIQALEEIRTTQKQKNLFKWSHKKSNSFNPEDKCLASPLKKVYLSFQLQKNISQFLKYQIHLCRFLSKAAQRTQNIKQQGQWRIDNQQSNLHDNFISTVANYLNKKTQQVKNLQIINKNLAKTYQAKSPNFQSILKYSTEYNLKFKNRFNWFICKNSLQTSDYKQSLLKKLQDYVKNHLKKSQIFYQSNIDKLQQQIIFIDYLNQIKQSIKVVDQHSFYLSTKDSLTIQEIESDQKKIKHIAKKLDQLKKFQLNWRQVNKENQ